METKNGKKKLLPIILVVLLVCVIVALAGVCFKLYTDSQNKQQDAAAQLPASGSSIVVSEDNKNVLGDIQEKVKKGMIEVKMTPNWIFENGGESSNAYLANSERNSYDLRFKLTLADSGEVLMESPDVPVGSCIENFPLSVTLEPGEYEIIIAHQQVENGEVINTVLTSTTITVK